MQQAGFPRTPLILGFISGPIVETNLQRALQSFRWTLRHISHGQSPLYSFWQRFFPRVFHPKEYPRFEKSQ
jgi:hypothetical protein